MIATGLILLAALIILLPTLAPLQRQRRLQQQLEQHRALLDALPEGLLLVNGDGRIRLHNAAAARLLGQSGTVLQGTPLQQWLPHSASTAARPFSAAC